MRDIELFDRPDFSRAKPWRPTSIGLAVLLVCGLAVLAVGVLLAAFAAGL